MQLRLNVLVAAESEPGIPNQPNPQVSRGLVNLGNSTTNLRIVITDPTPDAWRERPRIG